MDASAGYELYLKGLQNVIQNLQQKRGRETGDSQAMCEQNELDKDKEKTKTRLINKKDDDTRSCSVYTVLEIHFTKNKETRGLKSTH